MEDYDGLVGIYSRKNSLTQKLEEKFRQKYLDVLVFDEIEKIDVSRFSYLIINLLDFKRDTSILLPILKKVTCKVLMIHPLYVNTNERYLAETDLKEMLRANNNLGIMLVPDLLGKDVEFNDNALSHRLIMKSILSERFKISENGGFVNTITLSKLADRIIKDTFSFGISGEILALIGPRKSKKSFSVNYLGINKDNIVVGREDDDISEIHSTSTAHIDFSLSLAVKNTVTNFKNKTGIKVEESLLPEPVKNQSVNNAQQKRIKFNFKVVYSFIYICLFVLLVPVVLMLSSILLLFSSYKYAFENNNLSTFLINQSLKTSHLARNFSFGNNFIYDNANILYEVSNIAFEGVVVLEKSKEFVLKIMSDENYDLSYYSNNISASLEKIHTQASFLQSDINDLGGFTGNLLKNYLTRKSIDVYEYKNNLYDTKLLFSRISSLLGKDQPRKYLVLFQNNMELRPTGGFIGSFGLLTFDNGRLTDINISDVYTADGQLKGHVDPPEPIRLHLGEGGWYLRDSNWDPNFPVSATKAEWFLDKEIGVKVDGVITVDLFFIEKLLSVTGPILLTDFNKTVDAKNLYTIIQSEVEDTFFPGSIKKATILTSLSKSLITEVENLDGGKHFNLFKEIYESLEQKHIQIFLHDKHAQNAISNLGYSGEFDLSYDCGLRCFRDSYSIIDANLGVNKSNYYIERQHDLKVVVSKELINHELVVTYTNNANVAIGNSGIYKNYARVLLPTNANISGIRQYEADGSYSDLEYDLIDTDGRREAGFIFEVLPSTTKRIQIVWTVITDALSQGGEYNLNILKQSGTGSDILNVEIDSSDLSLTGGKVSKYNTNLSKDFKRRIFYRTYEN